MTNAMSPVSTASTEDSATNATDPGTADQQQAEVPSPGSRLPAPSKIYKFAEWGIYNYKAVVAYDGTAYK